MPPAEVARAAVAIMTVRNFILNLPAIWSAIYCVVVCFVVCRVLAVLRIVVSNGMCS